jgi:hypothetical protein
MKTRSSFAVLFTLVIAAILSGCGGSTSSTNTSASPANSAGADNPAEVAKGYFVALYSGAATDPFICTGNAALTNGLKQMGDAVAAGITSSGAKVDTAGLTYETANQTGDTANVKVSGKVKTVSAAGTSSAHDFPPQTLKVKKDNGWKVCGMGASA